MTVEFTVVRGESPEYGWTAPVEIPDGFEPFAVTWPVTGDQVVDQFGPWTFEITCWRRSA